MPDDSALLSTHPSATVDAPQNDAWRWDEGVGSARTTGRDAWAAERRIIEKAHAPFSPSLSAKRRAGEAAADWIKAFMNVSGLAALGKRNAKSIVLTTQSVVEPSLPNELDGLRILFISDPHFDSMPDFADALIDRARGLRCDLLLLGGDYRFGNGGAFVEHGVIDALKRLRAQVQVDLDSFAILGNHDCADMAPHIEKAGYRLLINETDTVSVGGSTVAVTGLDDVYTFATGAADDALTRGGLVPSDYSIAMVHSPELADEAAAAGHHLYLCGHTHGGQVCLPGGKHIIMPLHRNHDLASGSWQKGSMKGYTSRGAGTSGLPYRFNCPPEIVALTLKKA